ncbi:WG repeat-containing protein, partial [Stenotrophomonas maltophilia]|nr:WG repeat-containing protein [Stenotrophomonas maltophilia]
GCRRGTPDADGHTPMEGGEWFRIDRAGRRVK